MMMSEIRSRKVSLKLGNGITSNGGVRVMSVSIGSLSNSGYLQSDALAYAYDLAQAYTQVLLRIEETQVTDLTGGE